MPTQYLNGTLPSKQPVEPAPSVRIEPRVPERFLAAPVGFQIVLDENADAVRAAFPVANRVDAVGVTQDEVPGLGLRAEHNARPDARVPSTRLVESGEVINRRGSGGNHQAPLL